MDTQLYGDMSVTTGNLCSETANAAQLWDVESYKGRYELEFNIKRLPGNHRTVGEDVINQMLDGTAPACATEMGHAHARIMRA